MKDFTRRLTALVLSVILMVSFPVCAEEDGQQTIVAEEVAHVISPGLTYVRSVELHNDVRQELHTFTYTPNEGTILVPSYGKYLYGFSSVGQMIDSYGVDSGRVVGGINTDFFITSTGVPIAALASDYELLSTCDASPALGFREDGTAVIGYPKFTVSLSDEEKTFTIAHVNKVPSVWGFYLVTDRFSQTTRSKGETIDIVLRPYTEKPDPVYDGKDETDDGEHEPVEEAIALQNIGDSETPNVPKVDITSETPANTQDADDPENGEEIDPDPLEGFVFDEHKLLTTDEIPVVITEIRTAANTAIPEGAFVLCVPSAYAYAVEGLSIGDCFTLSSSADAIFCDCPIILGAGAVLLENGERTPKPDDSIYTYRNPRTAAGIREDGSVVFLAVDGRQKGKSAGFTFSELQEALLALGCRDAVNFDGGGSTTLYAADIGEIKARIKNSPSDKSERRVGEGLLFVNTAEPLDNVARGAMYPGTYCIFYKGTNITLSDTVLFADSNCYPVDLSDVWLSVGVEASYGETQDGSFTPNGKTGDAHIVAGFVSEDVAQYFNIGTVMITDVIDDLQLNASSCDLTPFETTKISYSASLNTIPVAVGRDSGEWSVSIVELTEEYGSAPEDLAHDHPVEDIEKPDDTDALPIEPDMPVIQVETLRDALPEEAYLDEDMNFVPLKKGETYEIRLSLGGETRSLRIFVDEQPFADMDGHWAVETAYEMYKSGQMIGEFSENGKRVFVPERDMTRAEFLTVLSRILVPELVVEEWQKIEEEAVEEEEEPKQDDGSENEQINGEEVSEPSEEAAANIPLELSDEELSQLLGEEEGPADASDATIPYTFDDVPAWALPYVRALYRIGALDILLESDEDGTLTLRASEPITRMDMIRLFGTMLDDHTENAVEFPDFLPERDEDAVYLARITGNGIIKGFEDGTIRQDTTVTRAQAATIFTRFCDLTAYTDAERTN